MGIFQKIKSGLQKTRQSILGGVSQVFHSFQSIDEELYEELEETLIMAGHWRHYLGADRGSIAAESEGREV